MNQPIQPQTVPDSEHRGLMAILPRSRAIMRRWPGWTGRSVGGCCSGPAPGACCWAGDALADDRALGLLAWLLLGSVAMRGAGCVYNDIVDVDIDQQVARTRARPIASGRVSKKAAWIWLVALCLIGLVVLLQLHWQAQLVALGSLALVAAYPFMKRITGWPQAWLGLVFTWGAPVGWVEVMGFEHLDVLGLLYLGCWGWCVGYDTIYACQDREDDALVGIGSSALSLGGRIARACWASTRGAGGWGWPSGACARMFWCWRRWPRWRRICCGRL
jgi:4-hydroxybenzoate polyprenyltransferase